MAEAIAVFALLPITLLFFLFHKLREDADDFRAEMTKRLDEVEARDFVVQNYIAPQARREDVVRGDGDGYVAEFSPDDDVVAMWAREQASFGKTVPAEQMKLQRRMWTEEGMI